MPSPLDVAEEDLRTLLFRSVRELVFNVVKHAGVDTAVVCAQRSADRLTIEVRDECSFNRLVLDSSRSDAPRRVAT